MQNIFRSSLSGRLAGWVSEVRNSVECQLDQPSTVKNVSLYLTAPGSNPGARILKIMLPQLCELCISDTYPEANSANLLAWHGAAM